MCNNIYGMCNKIYGMWNNIYGMWNNIYSMWNNIYGMWNNIYGIRITTGHTSKNKTAISICVVLEIVEFIPIRVIFNLDFVKKNFFSFSSTV